MKLNCDMGESFGHWTMGQDQAVMPWIDQASIACGFHAGDPDVMVQTIRWANQHSVSIGAHPGYADKQGFGRRSIPCSMDAISNLVAYQIGALQGLCQQQGTQLSYIKPHGALYNDMMADPGIFSAIVAGVKAFNLPLMLLARADNQAYQAMAEHAGINLIYEAFADRAYTPEGRLMPRSEPGAVLHQTDAILSQVSQLCQGYVTDSQGQHLALAADSICVHGDNPESIGLIRQISEAVHG